jgi:hypothetical protein
LRVGAEEYKKDLRVENPKMQRIHIYWEDIIKYSLFAPLLYFCNNLSKLQY